MTYAKPLQVTASLCLVWVFSLSVQAAEGCDPEPGRQLFETKCTACHSLTEHKVGPRLNDVYGRKAGSAEGFTYTPTLEQAAFTWDEKKLDAFLSGPMSFLPGTAMAFGGLHKPEERQAVICMLRQQGIKS